MKHPERHFSESDDRRHKLRDAVMPMRPITPPRNPMRPGERLQRLAADRQRQQANLL